MKAVLVTIPPSGPASRTDIARELSPQEQLDLIKGAIGGGYVEAVPGFTIAVIDEREWDCVAFCDEDGKRKRLPLNREATMLWHLALVAQGNRRGLNDALGNAVDVLVGHVAILAGDDEFMASLREP